MYVEKGSKYESRLRNLDNEVGGGISIHTVEGEAALPTELIHKVSQRKIPFTIVDSDIAQMNLSYYDSINIGLKVGFAQRSSWAVSKRNQWLADSIDVYAKEKVRLKNAGKPIEEFDLLIGCAAKAAGLTMVTHNVKHFSHIDGIEIEDWVVGK